MAGVVDQRDLDYLTYDEIAHWYTAYIMVREEESETIKSEEEKWNM